MPPPARARALAAVARNLPPRDGARAERLCARISRGVLGRGLLSTEVPTGRGRRRRRLRRPHKHTSRLNETHSARTPARTPRPSTPDYKTTVMHARTHAQARKHPHVDVHRRACECARTGHNRRQVGLHARLQTGEIITHQAGCPMNRSRLSLQTQLQKIRRYTWHHAYKAAFACGCILPGLGTDSMIAHDMVRRHIPATWYFDLTPHLRAWCRAGRRANRQQSPDNGTGPSN